MFAGDHIWLDMFNHLFDLERHYPSYNVRDLETNDLNVHQDILSILNDDISARYANYTNQTEGTEGRTFDLLVGHFLGIDHAGHTFYANHSEIERKVVETEQNIEEIIKALDNDTVLILYGDHGMTNDGNHGGGTQDELRTRLFGYSKSGFPMLK